jgi:hypothetical protein
MRDQWQQLFWMSSPQGGDRMKRFGKKRRHHLRKIRILLREMRNLCADGTVLPIRQSKEHGRHKCREIAD